MRVFSLMFVGLMFARSASAQVVKPADLVGQWVELSRSDSLLSTPLLYTLWADSRISVAATVLSDSLPPELSAELSALSAQKGDTISIVTSGSWRLTGDTLEVDMKNIAAILRSKAKMIPIGILESEEPSCSLVKLDSQRVILTDLLVKDAKPEILKRVDAGEP